MKKIFFLGLMLLSCFAYVSDTWAQIPNAKGKWQWANGVGSSGQIGGSQTMDERINIMRMDNKGNTYVCGRLFDNPYVKSFGQYGNRTQINNRLQKTNTLTGFIAKYDCNGTLQWLKQVGDTAYSSEIYDITIDTTGNVYAFASGYVLYNPTYFDTTLLFGVNLSTPLQTNGILLKISPTGNLLWKWTPSMKYGVATDIALKAAKTAKYYSYNNGSYLCMSHDTVSLLAILDTVWSGGNGVYLIDFDKNTGNMIQSTNTNLKFLGDIVQLGKDATGNFMLAINLSNDTFRFLDSVIKISSVSERGFILNFSRTHLLDYIFLNDSVAIYNANFDSPETGFEITTPIISGQRIINGYQDHTKGNFQCSPILHFSDLKHFRWGVCADSIGAIGAGFYNICRNAKGDIYSDFQCADFTTLQGTSFSNGFHGGNDYIMHFHSSDSIVQNMVTGDKVISPDFVYYTGLAVNEKGELTAVGNNNVNFKAGQDTAIYHGGNNDMFVIKYGYPCGSDSALIEPVATIILNATCQTDSVKLIWNDNSNIEWGYHIYRATGSRTATYNLIATTLPNTTTYFDKTISAGTNYWYKVAAYNNVGDGIATNIDSSMSCKAVGINTVVNKNNQLKIYPNPTNQLIMVSSQAILKSIEVIDVIGSVMQSQKLTTSNTVQSIDVSKFPSGIYFIKAIDESGIQQTTKFIKE